MTERPEPRWLTDTEMRAWAGFLEVSDLMQRLVELQLRETGGLTMVQYEILTRLNEAPGHRRTMTGLAASVICSRSGLTYQAGQLEKRGLLRREPDPDDDRGVLAVLTDEGRAILTSTAPGHLTTVREGLLDQLTEDQVTALAGIMDTARDHLRATVPLTPPRKPRSKA